MLLTALHTMATLSKTVAPAVVVDDLVLQRWGGAERVAKDRAKAAKSVVRNLTKVRLKIAMKKSRVLASPKPLVVPILRAGLLLPRGAVSFVHAVQRRGLPAEFRPVLVFAVRCGLHLELAE